MTTDIGSETHEDVEAGLDDVEFEFDGTGPDDEIDPEDDLEVVDDLDARDDLDAGDDLEVVDGLGGDDGLHTIDLVNGPDAAVAGVVVGAAIGPVAVAGAVTEVPVPPGTAAALAEPDADDDVLITDEVEASLDVILAERLRSSEDDSEDEVEDDDNEAPSQLATIIPVRRPEEFLCQSCFLLKPPGQLADVDHQLCRDCA